MTKTELAAFLESGHTLHVATIGPDGAPHLAPMWYVVEDGKVAFRSFTKSQKIINLKRDPRVTVLLERGLAYSDLQGVMIKGRAKLVDDLSSVLALYGRLAAKYPIVGDAPIQLDEAALAAAFGTYAAKNTGVIVEPTNIVSWDHTKLEGAY
jgi:PPOX class probable F420-dependent enzyme